MADGGAIPLLPKGIVLFESLPLCAVVIDALGPAVQDGIVVVEDGSRAACVLIRGGTVADSYAVDGAERVDGAAALRRIQEWPGAVVSARRVDAAIVDVLPVLVAGTVCYEDLRPEWTELTGLLRDLQSRAGTFVVEVSTPQGCGVTACRDGDSLFTYTDSADGSPSLLDDLGGSAHGSIRVRFAGGPSAMALDGALVELFGMRQPAITPRDVVAVRDQGVRSRELEAVLPELRALTRDRLQRASVTVEALLDSALARGRTLADAAREVRDMSVRGVVPDRMRSLADEMLALSEDRRDGLQDFLPA